MAKSLSPTLPVPHDEQFMRRALELASNNVHTGDGGPFGALVVRGEQVIAEGWNEVLKRKDPTAHAEIMAIRKAAKRLKHYHLQGCTLYASSEPCPMCLAAIYWARLDRIVFANPRAEAARIGFDDEAFYRELSLPQEKRQIPAQHLLLADADQPLKLWQQHHASTHY